MTKIAYVVSEYPAPSHTFIRREISALRRRGLDILPVSVRPGSGDKEERVLTILEEPWYRLSVYAARAIASAPLRSWRTWRLAQRHRTPGLRGWVWAQFHFVEAMILTALLEPARVSRIHSHFANSGATVGMLTARRLEVPWSLTLHGISETDPPAGALLSAKIAEAQFVACASWFMRAQGMRTVPATTWSKFHVVRCGVELDRVAEPAVASSDRLRLVTVGRISSEKGHPGLISAFQEILSSGLDATLDIVGDGPLRPQLEQQIASLHLSDRIALLGALSEEQTLSEIARADAFVLPSLMEGLPVVLMEAMILRKPVIAAAVAGIPELVQHEVTGLLFRPGDWHDLAKCMLRLAADPALRGCVGHRARLFVEQEYNIDVAVEPLIALFRHG